ncbi:MAG TPA: sensor histidine kinase [Lachnospiraceae bacterium]|nr:HAMP domain-containing sensor histidine kinase [uncultured Lachnoclostridium sp.]HAU86793.1 sensor histidine kinase [Lachnospiraceae bacterium]
MGKKTVKRRIFLSNTWMVLVTLLIFLAINIMVVRVYAEAIEQEFRIYMEQTVDDDALEELFEDYTIHRNEFLLLILADGILCITVLVLVSQFFTKRLVKHIMTPLNILADGAERIRRNDLTQNCDYQGDTEFEDVCDTFNDMRKSILTEQERNRKYEKARTDMIAGISHDLRTPLTAIRGTIKGLLDGVVSTPEQQNKFLQTAYRRTGDMDILLNQLFYLSKLETGNMPIDLRTIEISNFITNYVKEKQEIFTKEELEIAADTKGITGNVSVDPEQLSRIFDNLLENSRKYAKTRPLKIKISLNQIEEKVKVCFSDNGIGVAEEKLPYIFDEFYRADESRNKEDGNGLGLYIVKYLIEAMGGSVKAENADGFSVSMQLKKV